MIKKCFLGLFFLVLNCNEYECEKTLKKSVSCFEDFKISIRKTTTSKIDFSKQIDCFEWDSIEIGKRGSYKKQPCTNFYQINEKESGTYLGKNLENHMDWLDYDRNWTFVYFYKNGIFINDALAINSNVASFHKLKTNEIPLYIYNSENSKININ